MLQIFLIGLFLYAATYEDAMSLVRKGDFGPAVPILKRILAEKPADLRARNLLAIALASAGKRDEANLHLGRVLELNPAFVPALKNLAVNELELGRINDAKAHFEKALKLAPSDPAIHLGLGHVAFATGSFAAAIRYYDRSGGMHLRDPIAASRYAASHFEAGLSLVKLHQYEPAIQHFEKARVGSTDSYKVDFNLTLAYLKTKRFAEAIRAGERVPPAVEMYSLLAQAYEGAGRTNDAYEALRAATKLDPKDEAAYLNLIALCLNHENYKLSEEIADIGVRLIPGSANLRVQRGVVLALLSRLDEAEMEFKMALQLAPDAPLAHVAQGLLLLRMDRAAEAVDALRRRTSQKPGDHMANWLLAEALTRLGDDADSEAIAALERSIRANSALPQSRALLGRLLLKHGQTDRAVAELEKALRLDPGNIGATYQLAQAYRKKGDARRATELFATVGKAKAEDTAQFTQRSLLGIIQEGSGRTPGGEPVR